MLGRRVDAGVEQPADEVGVGDMARAVGRHGPEGTTGGRPSRTQDAQRLPALALNRSETTESDICRLSRPRPFGSNVRASSPKSAKPLTRGLGNPFTCAAMRRSSSLGQGRLTCAIAGAATSCGVLDNCRERDRDRQHMPNSNCVFFARHYPSSQAERILHGLFSGARDMRRKGMRPTHEEDRVRCRAVPSVRCPLALVMKSNSSPALPVPVPLSAALPRPTGAA